MLREVRVKALVAPEYPALDPDHWYTAAAVAGLVKGTRIVREGATIQFTERILNPDHFEFRGSEPRHGSWTGMHTRRLDRHPVIARAG